MMAKEIIDTGRNEVEMDLEKYTEMVLKLTSEHYQNDKIQKELKIATAAAQPVEKFSFGALFRDENDINEKSIIGFISFAMMVAFGITDLVTGFWGMDLAISDTIYTSFVVVTLGAFGISKLESISNKK